MSNRSKSIWEALEKNGYNERFNGILRHEVLNVEWFHSVKQAQLVINTWLKEFNYIRHRHALDMQLLMPEALLMKQQISGDDSRPPVSGGCHEQLILADGGVNGASPTFFSKEPRLCSGG